MLTIGQLATSITHENGRGKNCSRGAGALTSSTGIRGRAPDREPRRRSRSGVVTCLEGGNPKALPEVDEGDVELSDAADVFKKAYASLG